MPAATASVSSYQARNREAMMASQFSRSQQSARGARQASRNTGTSRTSNPRIARAGISPDSVRATAPSLPEESRQSTWQQNQIAANRATMAPPMPSEVSEMIEETPEVMSDPGFAEAQGDYAADYRAATTLGGGIGGKVAQARQMIQAAEKMKKRIEKIQKAIKTAKAARDWLWRLFGRGSPVEAEGAAVWSWLGSGSATTLYQSLKTVLQPESTFRTALGKTKGIDDGQFLKGILSVFEPNVLDPKNPVVWLLDAPYTLILIFILWQLFIYMNLAFVIIGALGLAVGGFAELLGEVGTFLSSFI